MNHIEDDVLNAYNQGYEEAKPKGGRIMARIDITCTEEEMDGILEAFEDNCPFHPPTKECGEDARCSDCLTDNINFNIIEIEEES